MFNIFQTGEVKNFSWNTKGNIQEGRKHLGDEMPVLMERLLQYSLRNELADRFRDEKFVPITGEMVLTVEEDLECSGHPITGDSVWNYEEGFLTGVITAYTEKEYVVKEVDCWASGSHVCRFEAMIDQQAKV